MRRRASAATWAPSRRARRPRITSARCSSSSAVAERPDFHEWRPHPWHGLEAGRAPPLYVNAYIEITPFDLIKYEVDKASGYLKVDRPQRTSSQPPSLYGFIPDRKSTRL